ncbi:MULTISPECIES: phage tail protein [Streptomyces]|uniref:Phage tail protein n=1 Tax=Streptomyces dengpaensis TaxID=2049881 RepID=A0ABN5I456_9ACTN|nr:MULTISPECIES: phage tail protein [Streptomyces]AVH57781.1 phage tail protein [Streptomyces dengpaensis]PIB03498.1 hypothetical protein B1C81_37015 [Streptomyces sp. HG99]
MSDDVTITVRVNNQTAAGFRDVNGNLRDMQGRFAAASNDVQRSGARMSKSMLDIRASMLSLAPAAVPVAASLAPIAVQAGAAGLAIGAFGAALKPQLASLSNVSKAQDAYTESVKKYGAHSSQAAQAQLAASQTLKGMPAATQRAAVAFQQLREESTAWSDSLAKFTMAPVEKSFAVLGQVIPKLTPMVKGASTELTRLVDVAAGGVNTSAFDTLSKKVSDFSNNALKGATDKAIHFMRVLSEGNAHGPIASFFEYARAQGPAVKELLSNVAEAVSNLLQGAAQAGPGLLTLVNAFAKLVASVPASLIANLMQVYAAFKLITLAGAGVAAVGAGLATLQTRITTIATASAAATTGVGRMRAGFAALGTAAKASVVIGGLALLAIGIKKLSDEAKGAPPDVDKLTSSLKQLASTGKFTGELKKTFGDVNGLVDKIKLLNKETAKSKETAFGFRIPGLDDLADKIADSINNMSKGDKSLGALKDDFASLDKGMADLVSSGYAKQAAVDFDMVKKAALAEGHSLKEVNALFPKYIDHVADAKWEQEQATKSMGVYGAQSLAVQAKLDAQKKAASGLTQSIHALNSVYLESRGDVRAMEEAIDAATETLKKNGKTLDDNTDAGRQNNAALDAIASTTMKAMEAKYAETGSWVEALKVYDRGRSALDKATLSVSKNSTEAKKLADQILRTPNKTALIKGDIKDLTQKIADAKGKLKNAPSSKTAHIKGEIRDLQRKVAAAKAELLGIKGRSVTVQVRTAGIGAAAAAIAGLGGIPVLARGGRVRGYAGGGNIQHFPNGGYVQGPGTATSDSVYATFGSGADAAVSNTEYVIQSKAVRKYGVAMLDALNEGQLKIARLAKGGLTQGEKDARGTLRGQFGISTFGRAAGYQRTPFEKNLGAPTDIHSLVSSLNEAAGNIRRATSGRTESRLLRQLDSVGKGLIKYEKQLTSVNKALEGAKGKLNDLKSSASQLSSSVRSNILGSANITRGAQGDAPLTVASIMGSATASRDKAKAFADALKQLQKKGLDKGLIEDIASAGVEGGGLETAGALMSASSSEIKSLNTLRSQTATYAKQAGGTASDAVYGAAIKAQEAYVKNLTKQQDKLEKTMANLAKTMERAISKAIGKKAAGGIVGAAASGGVRSNLTWVGEHGAELLDLPAGSRVWSNPDSRRKAAAPWASMLNTPRGGGVRRTATPVGGGQGGGGWEGRPIVVQMQLGGRDLGEVIIDPLRKSIRHRGGNVQAALGSY